MMSKMKTIFKEKGILSDEEIKRYRESAEIEETYYYGELGKVRGYIFLGVTISFEGYRVLWFKKGKRLVAVFIDW